MKLTLEMYGNIYTVETDHDDMNSDELKEIFSRLLVQATFSPSVIDPEDGGSFQYVSEDEKVVKKNPDE